MDVSPAALLRAYDDQLRTDAEAHGAVRVDRFGPLHLVVFSGGRGFVSYRDLAGADAGTIRSWVGATVVHFAAAEVDRVEWKTRGHDRAPGLHAALVEHGFVPQDEESIMVGPLAGLVADVPLPAGVTLRRIDTERDVRAMCVMADEVFGSSRAVTMTEALLAGIARGDTTELWVAEAEGRIVSSGRLEPVAGTDFAGIWGGGTLPPWRGRGIYRALTSARARSALALGKALAHSDSTEYSRPILERAGLVKISTTTPYEWAPDRRGG
jgi:ribosomal protein S18 acetylase RimI-like enzyme